MTTPTSHSKARTAGRDDDGSYYADGRTVFRNPVTTVNPSGGKNITLGFPVCNLHDACPDEGAAIIAKCLNAHEDLVANAADFDKLSLVIESAVRNISPTHHDRVVALIKANRAALASLPAPQVRT